VTWPRADVRWEFPRIVQTRPERRVITVLEIGQPVEQIRGNGPRTTIARSSAIWRRVVLAWWKSICCGPVARAAVRWAVAAFLSHPPTRYVSIAAEGERRDLRCAPAGAATGHSRALRETDAMCPWTCKPSSRSVPHGRYDDIDYTVPPVPPLDADDATWRRLLRAAGQRPGASRTLWFLTMVISDGKTQNMVSTSMLPLLCVLGVSVVHSNVWPKRCPVVFIECGG